MKTTLKGLLLLAALLVLAVSAAQAAIDPATVKKLIAADGAAGDEFGYSVAISGSTAIVGARSDDSKKGAAYIFTRATNGSWSQQQKLIAADGAVGDEFGYSVAISGSTAIVGAQGSDSKKGAVYVFTSTGSVWSQQQKLVAADGVLNDDFGYSVAVSGDTAIIGAAGANSIKGAVYIFTRAGSAWSQQQKLPAPNDGAALFGGSVSLSLDGNTALIGASFSGGETGAAYVFTRSGSVWSQQQRLNATDGAGMDAFGCSVSLSSDGSTALIGAYWNNDGKGAAYVFTRSGSVWSQQQKLIATDGAAYDSFGTSVSLSADGSTGLIGQSTGNPSSIAGSAYVFTRSGSVWSQQQKLTADAGKTFGGAVAVDGDAVIIGASSDSDKGSAYVFGGSATPPVTHQGAAQAAINSLLLH